MKIKKHNVKETANNTNGVSRLFGMSGLLFLRRRATIKRVRPVGFAWLIYIPHHLSRVRPKSPKWSAAVSARLIKTVQENTAQEAASSSRLALMPKRWGGLDGGDQK